MTFGSHNIRGIHGRPASLTLEYSGELILNVGQDDNWADAFLDSAMHLMNQAKLT
jgi:hypothetical protein